MEQPRLKSFVVWSAIVAQVVSIFQLAGVFQALGIDAGLVGDIAAGVLQLLVLFGVLNNPTNKTGF